MLQGLKRELMPGLMTPAEVAKQALRQLGEAPLHIPGPQNRKYVHMMRRMPRERLIAFNAQSMSAALDASGRPVASDGAGAQRPSEVPSEA